MRYMKYIRFIIAALAVTLVFSCDNENVQIQPDNDFTFECDAPQWRPDANGQADTLVFGWESAKANVNIKHEASSNAWKVRCSLDDAWANYDAVDDVLIVKVEANIGVQVRKTSLDVVMGENSKKIVVIQGSYPRNGSQLPETGWDDEEDPWVGKTE